MNNKGFIATSLIYSFFLVFITLFLTIIADYLQDKVLLNTIESSIKGELNQGVEPNTLDGKKVVFQGNFKSLDQNIDGNGTTVYRVKIDGNNMTLSPDNIEIGNITIDNINKYKFIKESYDKDIITIVGIKENT